MNINIEHLKKQFAQQISESAFNVFIMIFLKKLASKEKQEALHANQSGDIHPPSLHWQIKTKALTGVTTLGNRVFHRKLIIILVSIPEHFKFHLFWFVFSLGWLQTAWEINLLMLPKSFVWTKRLRFSFWNSFFQPLKNDILITPFIMRWRPSHRPSPQAHWIW